MFIYLIWKKRNNKSNYEFRKNKLNHFNSNSINYEKKFIRTSLLQKGNSNQTKEFHVSNINKNLDGKEFTKKITPKMLTRCLSAISGGPKETNKKIFILEK